MERYARAVPSTKQGARTRTASVEVTDSLIDAALALLEESGFAALTVRAVASRADVAPMGVYSRFGSKDGLLEALFVSGFGQLHETIDVPPSRKPLARLRAGCRAYREFAISNPHLYHLMFEQMNNLDLSIDAQEAAKATFAMLVERVQSAMDAKSLDSADATEVAQEIWSAMHGAVSLEIADVHFANDRAENFSALMDTLMRGLGAKASALSQ